MDEWSQGYVADIAYTVGFYRELSPSMQQFVLTQQGIAPPHASEAEFQYFELGFGQGLSLNVNACVHPLGRFWGNDFNPQHVLFAQQMAGESGVPISVFDSSFEELLDQDFPAFDYISLHGVWSWISEENKQAIVQFIRRNLKIGGAVFISYNTLPGWAAAMPLRHLMKEHEGLANSLGGTRLDRIRQSLTFAESLATAGSSYFKSNPSLADRLKTLQKQNVSYLAHEYFNRDWTPMYFSDIARYMAGAKLTYAGSASLLESVPGLSITPEMRKILDSIEKLEFRETVRDFLLNTQFRRDVFVRGAQRLTRAETASRLQSFRFTLITPPAKVKYSVNVASRQAELQRDIYEPLVQTLGKAEGGLTLSELRASPTLATLSPPTIMQALTVLVGMGNVNVHVGPQADEASIKALNRHIARRAEDSPETGFMVAGKAGGAVALDRFEQLFMRAASEGKDPAAAAAAVWEMINARGERISKEGKPLLDADANRAELLTIAKRFFEESLPRMREIGVSL